MRGLEERIVRELQAERDLVPPTKPGPMPVAPARWPRYLGVAAALALVVGAGFVVSRFDASDFDLAAVVQRGEFLVDAEVVVPIDGDLGTVEARGQRLTVLAGGRAPSPQFDLDLGGIEQPLVQGVPRWDQTTWAGNVPLVYIGSPGGRSVFLHTNGTIGWFDRLQMTLSGDRLSDHICMTIGDSNSDLGGSGFCSSAAGSYGGRLHNNEQGAAVDAWWATWIDVPEGTAVVTLTIGSESVAWQTPVAETAFFDLKDAPNGAVSMTAIGVDGSELATESVPVVVFER